MRPRVLVTTAAAVALLAACGPPGAGEDVPTPRVPRTVAETPSPPAGGLPAPTAGVERTHTITLEGGAPRDGLDTITVRLGTEIEIVVVADATHQVHIHGYDLLQEVTTDVPAAFRFTAHIPGTFEIELEDEHRKIGELQVAE